MKLLRALLVVGTLLPTMSVAVERVINWECDLVDTNTSFGEGKHALTLADRNITLHLITNTKVEKSWIYKVVQADIDGRLRAYRVLNNRSENTRLGGELFITGVTKEGATVMISYSDSDKTAVGIATGSCKRLAAHFSNLKS
ncbi:hypothetical protein IC617_08915 [Neiella sp. HB171785]|uniref:Uncharacterized protein n=1 Tax=Neiella litorisoli TaxID=2771431 RepID=A0A8J6QUV3_9GAMM|nr:hypothetical protein [Neiella litorisoli]MBD1389548.1 hypothetical protein [Neiella litorisoli]